MRCPACRNPCLDTDLRCPHCQHSLVSTDPEAQLSPASVCGLIFAALTAGTVAMVPMPEGIEINQFALAGLGAGVGGVIGAVVGWLFERSKKKSAQTPSTPADGTAVGM
jgi:hypothetical protein